MIQFRTSRELIVNSAMKMASSTPAENAERLGAGSIAASVRGATITADSRSAELLAGGCDERRRPWEER
jgi:hypothetical protein